MVGRIQIREKEHAQEQLERLASAYVLLTRLQVLGLTYLQRKLGNVLLICIRVLLSTHHAGVAVSQILSSDMDRS